MRLVVVLVLALPIAAAKDRQDPQAAPPPGLTIKVLDGMTRLPGGLTALPKAPVPRQNPQTPGKVDLGRTLFFDRRLSRDGSISCSTCHDPGKAYSDGRSLPVGTGHAVLRRRSPSLLDSAYNSSQFWDGRAQTLEEQALSPILSRSEMGMPDANALLARLQTIPEYRRRFLKVFRRDITLVDVRRAIAAFERTLVTPNSPFDRYAEGDKTALTESQKRGLILFIGKASCSQCHNGPNFTDNKFHSLGASRAPSGDVDLGRFLVSGNPADRQAFKTPTLRNAAQQSPYMHDGSIKTLPNVIEFYSQGGGAAPKSKLLFPLHLTAAEKEELLDFLRSLAGHLAPETKAVANR